MIDNYSLAEIKTFVAIVDAGSLTRAAEVLGVSRAYVSKQLKKLETSIGVQLIIRTTRSQKLTEAGVVLFNASEKALDKIHATVNTVSKTSESQTGIIKINSLGGVFGEHYLSKAIADFCQKYPNITFDISFDSHRVDLIQDSVDIIIRAGELEGSNMISRFLMPMKMGIYASKNYLKTHDIITNPNQIKNHKCLVGSITKWNFKNKQGRLKSIDVNPFIYCKNGRAIREFTKKGLGIARLPELYIEDLIADGLIESAIQGWTISPIDIHILYSKYLYQPLKIKSFIEFLVDWFRVKHNQ